MSNNEPTEEAQPAKGGVKGSTMIGFSSMVAAVTGAAGGQWWVLLVVAVIMTVCGTVTAVVPHLMPQKSPDRLRLWCKVIDRRGAVHHRYGTQSNGRTTLRALHGPNDGHQEGLDCGPRQPER